MLTIKRRDHRKELMDLGPSFYSVAEYRDCLKKLGLIGTVLGGDAVTLGAIKQLKQKPTSILDVGCGGGFLTTKLARAFPDAQVVGIDINKQALTVANAYKRSREAHLGIKLKNLKFFHREIPVLKNLGRNFDVVTSSSVCHHLDDDEIIEFLQDAKKVARQAIVLNDLHRHPIAYGAFWCLSPAFYNRLIRHDGLISIRRAFTRTDLEDYLRQAGLFEHCWRIHWKWPFRWAVTIFCGD